MNLGTYLHSHLHERDCLLANSLFSRSIATLQGISSPRRDQPVSSRCGQGDAAYDGIYETNKNTQTRGEHLFRRMGQRETPIRTNFVGKSSARCMVLL